ncbi:Guanylate kinase [Ferriphaselus amnicola]|uniref:Guanylate kinase n=1 Tax=Ferriphaselus amnicola TaxID=1188319 RepID=A0A2Z6GFJ2_9PROT|nr:guanylate kinase [Ferriphaselus amnicola]BBE52162.1 Guanylate kinase [Ferriphaselus amnicola]
MSGNLFIISAPSGAGKTSLVQRLLVINSGIRLSISYTTRLPRPGEVNGREYHFVSRDEFVQMSERGDFLESAEVYGNLYGTSESWINSQLHEGSDILLEIDWQGAAQVRRLFPEAISIFILPPSIEALHTRLSGRRQDSEEVIANRMAAAREDISHVSEFDYVIINDKLDEALRQLDAVVIAARQQRKRQMVRYQDLINQLQSLE